MNKGKNMYTVSIKMVIWVFDNELGREDVGNRKMAQILRDNIWEIWIRNKTKKGTQTDPKLNLSIIVPMM